MLPSWSSMKSVSEFLFWVSNFIWGVPLLILLLGGGFFFLFYSQFLPFRYFVHAVHVLRGKYDNEDDPGEINHFEALSGALASTIGMGNISGVALAIATGGPGTLFWMWMSAFLGMATKFFTCTLSVLFRGNDSNGDLQGVPMYVIREGLNKRWHFLAVFFCVAGFFGSTPVFQANQTVAVLQSVIFKEAGIEVNFWSNLLIGIVLASLVAIVIIGGIKRIGYVASKLVPAMVILYVLSVLIIIFSNSGKIVPTFFSLFPMPLQPKRLLGVRLVLLL